MSTVQWKTGCQNKCQSIDSFITLDQDLTRKKYEMSWISGTIYLTITKRVPTESQCPHNSFCTTYLAIGPQLRLKWPLEKVYCVFLPLKCSLLSWVTKLSLINPTIDVKPRFVFGNFSELEWASIICLLGLPTSGCIGCLNSNEPGENFHKQAPRQWPKVPPLARSLTSQVLDFNSTTSI